MYQGKHDQALAEAEKLDTAAQNDADRRFALFTKALVYVDQGKTDAALKEIQKQYALAAKIGDTATMAGDAETMGDILLHAGKPDEAAKALRTGLEPDGQVQPSPGGEGRRDARPPLQPGTGRAGQEGFG